MNQTLGKLITATIFLTLTIGCTGKKITTSSADQTTTQTEEVVTAHTEPAVTTTSATVETQVPTPDTNRFRVTRPEQVGNVEVVCRNCHAHFKLSQHIQKMSIKGDAIIDCPVCHHDYLGKH